MHLKEGSPVELRLGEDEYVQGEVVSTDIPDMFSDGWSILAIISEGGHPQFGQLGIFGAREVTFTEATA